MKMLNKYSILLWAAFFSKYNESTYYEEYFVAAN